MNNKDAVNLIKLIQDPLAYRSSYNDYNSLVFLSGGEPRWIVHSDATDLSTLSDWRPYGKLKQIIWNYLTQAIRKRDHNRIYKYSIKVIAVPIKFSSNTSFFSRTNTIYIARRSENQKAVIFFNNGGRQEAIKIQIGKNAGIQLTREILALKSNTISKDIKPELIDYSLDYPVWYSAKYISGDSAPENLTKEIVEASEGLRLDTCLTEVELHHFVEKWISNANSGIANSEDVASDAIHLSNVRSFLPLRASIIHGDFCPWNFKITKGGLQHILIDWEAFQEKGPATWDLIHFVISTQALLNNPLPQPKILYKTLLELGLSQTCLSLEGFTTLVHLYSRIELIREHTSEKYKARISEYLESAF